MGSTPVLSTKFYIMGKMLVFQTDGLGMEFTFVTIGNFADVSAMDGKTIGNATFYLAEILQGEDGDIDNMVITIPYIYKCGPLGFDSKKQAFTDTLNF